MKKWSDVTADSRYQSASPEVQERIRNDFFNQVIAPDVPDGVDLREVRQQFDLKTDPMLEKPTFLGALKDRLVANKKLGEDIIGSVFGKEKSVVAGMGQDDAPDIAARGGPLSEQGHARVKATFESGDASTRQSLTSRPGAIGNAARQIDEAYQAADKKVPERQTDRRIESRENRLLNDGVAPSTARVLASQGGDVNTIAKIEASPEKESKLPDWMLASAKIAPTTAKMLIDTARLSGEYVPIVGDILINASDKAEAVIGEISSQQSPELQSKSMQLGQLIKAGDRAQVTSYLAANPDLLANIAIPSAGSMFVAAAPGVGMRLLGASAEAATGTTIATNAMMNAGSAFAEAQGDPLARYTAAGIAGIGTLVVGKVTGGGAEGAIARGATGAGGSLASRVAQGAIEGVKTAGKEYAQEFGEGATEALGTQVADVLAGQRENISRQEILNQGQVEGAAGLVLGGSVGMFQAMQEAELRTANEEAQAALDAIPNAQTVDDAIALFNEASKAPLVSPPATVVAPETVIESQAAPAEAIDAAELVDGLPAEGEPNVSEQNDNAAGLVAETVVAEPDLGQGGMGNLSAEPDAGEYRGRLDNTPAAPAQGSGNDQPLGDATGGSDAVTPEQSAPRITFLNAKEGDIVNMGDVQYRTQKELAKFKDMADQFDSGANKSEELAGEKIDREWTAFADDSGSLGIPRAEMPQIKAEHRGAMVNFLNARGISHEQDEVPASELKPTQAEFSPGKVQKAKDFGGGDRSILVSSDGHVLDGHHQWMAKLDENGTVPVIRLNAPIRKLISEVSQFPSAETAAGATEAVNSDRSQNVAYIGSKNSGETISVQRDGNVLRVLHNGDPLIDYESEKEVTLPVTASINEIRDAVKKSGQFPKRIITYVKDYQALPAPAPAAKEKAEAKPAEASQQDLFKKPWHELTLDRFVEQQKDFWRAKNLDISQYAQDFTPEAMAQSHMDFIETALEEGETVPKNVLEGHDIDPKEYPLAYELKTGKKPRKSQAVSGNGGVKDAEVDREWAMKKYGEQPTGATRVANASYALNDLKDKLKAETERPNLNKHDHANIIDDLNRQIAAIEAIMPTLEEMDRRGQSEDLQRFMLRSAKQELDASVRAGEMSQEQYDQAVERARTTGNTLAAVESIESDVDANSQQKIEDFGDKIGGARKDVWASYKDKLDEALTEDVKAVPLSKSWPEPDYQALLDGGADPWAVAFAHAARDEVPTKPQKSWKLKSWASQVEMLRDTTHKLMSGEFDAENARKLMAENSALSSVHDRAELYQRVGHSQSLKGIRISVGHYSLLDGVEYKPAKTIWSVEKDAKATAFSNWPKQFAMGDTREAVIEEFAKKFETLTLQEPAKKEVSFNIYSKRGENGFWIGKKVGRNYIDLEKFDILKDARAYLVDHQTELLAKLEKSKEIPNVRRDTNNPRVGEDMRGGQDVTPQQFGETFGFKGVEFGNWVEQKKRQQDLNDAFDALMDMAAILDIPPKAISLNGELGLAFGARGKGGIDPAKAHYEPDYVVINMTKKDGAGSLGHEWWHALDNYFSRMRGWRTDFTTEALDVSLASRGSTFIANTEVRKEMVQAFGEVMKAIRGTALKARSSKLDAKRSKEYWTTSVEMSARAYESYLISKLQDQNASNDYLANIVDEQTWKAAESIGFELDDSYPYPTAGEVPAIRAAFDHFFDTIQHKETESGVALFSRGDGAGISLDRAQKIIDEIAAKYPALPKAKVVSNYLELPAERSVIDEITAQKAGREQAMRSFLESPSEAGMQAFKSATVNDIEGMHHNGAIYINAGAIHSEQRLREVFAHEAIGHYSIEAMLEEVQPSLMGKLVKQVNMLDKAGNKYIRQLAEAVDETQPGLGAEARAKEIIAQIAERGDQDAELAPAVRGLWQRIVDGIKAFAKLVFDVDLTDRDVRDIVAMAARYAKGEDVAGMVRESTESYSRRNRVPSKVSGDTIVTAAAEYLARNPDLFQLTRTEAKSMDQIGKDIDAGYTAKEMSKSRAGLVRADNGWEISIPNSARSAMIYQKGDDVWIDVSRLQPGRDSGSVVYAMAASYAHNNGKVLIGDPAGLSRAAYYRRNEAMLSSALKYGTTRHLAPHVAQEVPADYYGGQGEAEFGKSVRPLNWIVGDDVNNIREMIYTSWKSGIDNVPELKNVIFNPDTQRFERLDGTPFDDGDFEKLVSRYGTQATNPYRAGSATQKRTALFNTFLRPAGGEGGKRLLDSFVHQLQPGSGLAAPLKGIFYSRSNPDQGRINPSWDTPEASTLDNLIYTLQDKNIDLKRVTQEIQKVGNEIDDRWNAYLQEELYHGRSAKRTQDFIKEELEPLIEDMRMRRVSMADFEEYLWMRHAEEYNIQIAKVNPDMPDGGSGIATEEARSYLAGLSQDRRANFEALAAKIDAITNKSRQTLIDYGLESRSTIKAWEDTYKHYVPLQREDMETGFGNGTGQGYSVRGNSAKRATGSKRAVVDILANIAMQRERNIIRGEKNRVATALIGLATLNPNPEFWKVDTVPQIKEVGKDGLVTHRPDPNYKSRNNVVVARIVNKLGKVVEHSVVFNQFDERAMRMAASLKNLDQDQIGELLGMASSVTRYFASVNTQYNPIFGAINITRDVQGALFNLESTPLSGKQREVMKYTGSALKGIYAEIRSVRKGEKADTKWAELWEEFQREGGKTGYRDMYRNAKMRGEAIEHALDPEWWQKTKWGKTLSIGGVLAAPQQWVVSKPGKAIFDWLSDYNEALENAVRLAAYKVATDQGLTKQRAASIAKNLTVNFNRKGEMGRQIGALYAFFNASVQGTARIAETMFKDGKLSRAGKQIVAGGMMLGSMQAMLLAAAGFDDDEPPEFVRDRNVIIPLGDGKYITIPMPLGYNAIPATGRILTEWAMDDFDDTQARFKHLVEVYMDMFNPIGYSGMSMQTLSPTALDPVAALAENKDWTGRPIAREDFSSLDPTPGFTRAKDTASSVSTGIAYGINWLTGGTDYIPGEFSPTPDQIDYLIGQVFGGVGREYMKLDQTATSMVTGDELPPYKIPLLGRFYGDASGLSAQGGTFYNNLIRMNKHKREIEGRIENDGDVDGYIAENPEAELVDYANATYSRIRKIRQQRQKLKDEGASTGELKELDAEITALMFDFNQEVKSLRDTEPAE